MGTPVPMSLVLPTAKASPEPVPIPFREPVSAGTVCGAPFFAMDTVSVPPVAPLYPTDQTVDELAPRARLLTTMLTLRLLSTDDQLEPLKCCSGRSEERRVRK